MAVRLLRLTKLSRRRSVRQCPFCGKAMLVVNNPEPALELDACRPCNIIWVDAPSYETLPEFTFETTSSMQLQSTEIFAMERLKEFKEKEEEERQKARKKKKPLHRIVKKWNEAEG